MRSLSIQLQCRVNLQEVVKHTFQPLVAVVLINEHIVYTDMLVTSPGIACTSHSE
jgi:hypothetical protein